jgi:hypothetical protein
MALIKLRKSNEAGEEVGVLYTNTDQILTISAGQNATEVQMGDGRTRWVKDSCPECQDRGAVNQTFMIGHGSSLANGIARAQLLIQRDGLKIGGLASSSIRLPLNYQILGFNRTCRGF